MKRALFRIAAVLCIALAAFFLMPVFGGILHFGMIWYCCRQRRCCCGRTSSAACCGPDGCGGP